MAETKSVVRTVGHVSKFVVDDKLTVTSEGVELSVADVAKVQKSAEENGVMLDVQPVSTKTGPGPEGS